MNFVTEIFIFLFLILLFDFLSIVLLFEQNPC